MMRGIRSTRDAGLAASVAAIVFVTRLPFLSAGFGADPDAWRVVVAAQNIVSHHEYFASRFPGFPIPELAYALLLSGPVTMNGVTALFSALAAGGFSVLARRLGLRAPALAGLMLAATPIIWVNSTVTMDYLWSLAFAIAGLLALVDGLVLLAGVAIGLAAGCRITAILFLVPASILLVTARRPLRDVVRIAASASAVAGLSFVPVILRFSGGLARSGASFLAPPVRAIPPHEVAEMATIGVWGVVGWWTIVVACVGIAVDRLRRRHVRGASRPAPDETGKRSVLLLGASGLAVFLLVFIRLPYEPGYLIPIVPFTILGLGALLGCRAFACVTALVALSSFVSVSGEGISRGPLLEDLRMRKLVVQRAEAILAEGDRLTAPTVVVCRNWFPAVAVLLTERGCLGRTALEEVEQRRITCGNATYVKALAALDGPQGEVVHLAPAPGRRTLGAGFPYPERR